MADATICGLFLSRGPAHIAGRIGSVVVDPIKCVFWGGSLADVVVEREEGCAPHVAHHDAASPVIAVMRMPRVMASPDDISPQHIVLSAGESMGRELGCQAIQFEAATGFAMSAPQGGGLDRPLGPAFAAAEPLRAMRDQRKGGPAMEDISGAWGGQGRCGGDTPCRPAYSISLPADPVVS